MAKVRPYYAEASLSVAFYDVVTAGDAHLGGDLEVYADLTQAGGAVLEFGVGAGRVATHLAALGRRVTGVDLSPAMLQRARAGLRDLDPAVAERVTLRQGDMAALSLEATFETVIFSYFTLAHAPAGSAWARAFATAQAHLAPGGVVCVHLPRLEVMAGLGPVDPARVVFEAPLDGGRRLRLRVAERAFREAQGRLDQAIDYAVEDAAGRVLARSLERLTYYMADPRPAAAAAGLACTEPLRPIGGAGDIWIFRGA